ncbi:hypothetical protein BY458DRAFT_499930 [Sporodiniella umbellata]|nr:hypothetical protein BY458DRAFT_499930 [Sporodiniella umbellata]
MGDSIKTPLQTEIMTLNKLIDNDIVELSASLLDASPKTKQESEITNALLEKCEDVETICEHLESVLRKARHVLTTSQPTKEEEEDPMDIVPEEEDMEELLQIQKDRLDRLRNVIVLGMDADTAGHLDNKEDLLF